MREKGQHRRSSRLPRVWLLALLPALIGGAIALRVATDQGHHSATTPSLATPLSTTSPAPPGSPSTASPTPSSPAAKGQLLIHGAGDVNIDPSFIRNFQTHGYAWAWSGLNGLFKTDDLTIVNLECAVSDLGTRVPKEFNFRGDPNALPTMRAAGVEVANMGNNHSYDFGPDALLDTRKNLLANGIAPVGAGKDPAQANAPAIFVVNGWTLAVVGFDKVVDPYPDAIAAPGHPGTADGHNTDAMVAAVRAAAEEAEIVIVAIHWGVELDTEPRPADVGLAHRFIEAGADIIFGGHSHRLQPMERYKGKLIFYSLANFVWPDFSEAGATTAVAEVTVSAKGKLTGRLIAAFIEEAGHPVLTGT
jgi:poly-gamma-glutamate synthesis protein (capsule biosynthesis protein)